MTADQALPLSATMQLVRALIAENVQLPTVTARLLLERHDALTARAEKAEAERDALKARVEGLEATGRQILDRMSGTYKARNGRVMGIESDDGEKCWIVHDDEIESLRSILGGELVADQWRLIDDEVPKDGTEILLGRFAAEPAEYDGRVRVDWWRRPEDDEGFIGFGHFNPTYWPPTHWKHLPKRPLAALQAAQEPKS